MQPPQVSVAPSAAGPLLAPSRRDALMGKARELETAFLAEMLAHAGLGPVKGAFSGGVGEDQFASFLREAQARAIVENGGIGLAQRLYEAMARNDHAGE